MGVKTIEALVDGGKASAGPPIGPALGPTGVNVLQVVKKINELTEPFAGLKVPVKIHVNDETKTFEIEVGTPPASALIVKALGKEKGSQKPKTDIIGDLPLEKIIEIAKAKMPSLLCDSLKSAVKTILGTCVSLGVTVNGVNPKQIIKKINDGEFDNILK
ncbi:MAG: 50S ribosomal protein L11 [Candidatus Odinarchaeum yellowstonii]|uniref:Large ribosomal subunit protein uL11 n=1 Tax=Odinarchaeota yellowstonii (strain LCB_4) TaxID=1841599 RepID=A0AAF0D359_ODILC|nr:MAG: 50S ribosomal protein L11 [Candidatus Odinarchaeum yellowstonii]